MKAILRKTLAAASGLLLLTGCQSAVREGAFYSITDIISGVTDASGTYSATLVRGDAPAAGAGPTAAVTGIGVLINGGSTAPNVAGSASFTRVIITIDGMKDYFELTLPAGVSAQGLIITASPEASATTLNFLYAVGDQTSVGSYAMQSVRFIPVAHGDIQVSVAWDDSSDVDLHVIDPNGDEVHFPAPGTVPSGGYLDLDSNPACSFDHKNNENVVWPTGRAIPGNYTVFVDYWSDCGRPATNYVVTIQRIGAAPQTFTGTFVGAASGVPNDTVATFSY